ncbi:aspartate-alanine antiporter [Bordetella sp. FB-8]|uniref:aspartate-alanine antiporter n=1 Tax=Bordetella sp. FB-8 TaxID=1159870 RepID=UPI00036E8173|nr:aspartate-alanine antiporter [Bordetella sp. FB-8]
MMHILPAIQAMAQGWLQGRPEIAIFLAIAVGYAIGAIKVGAFKLGGVAGTLLVALAIGQFGIQIDPLLSRFMFTLFIYALGFSVAPQFFASIDRTTWTWMLLVVIEAVLIVTVTFAAAWIFKLDIGTASGLLAGSATESAMVGTGIEAIGKLGLSAAAIKALEANVTTAYALSYVFSLVAIILFASQLAPWLLRIDLRKEARAALARLGGADLNLEPDQRYSSAPLVSRGYRVTAAAGKTVAALEAQLGGQAVVQSIRHGQAQMPATGAYLLDVDDEIAVAGLRVSLAGADRIIGPEIGDLSDVKFILETRDVVLVHRPMHGLTVDNLLEFLKTAACHGVFLAGITRMQRDLPATPGSKVRMGDVLRLFGRPDDVARATRLLGVADIPSNVTDFVYCCGGLVIGILIGMVSISLGTASLSLGSAGALLSGLGLGWLRSLRPTFGRFPAAAAQLLKDLGLAVFIACIGITSAPAVLTLLQTKGWQLPVCAVFISLVPTLASVYIGRYVLRIEPAILCGAIAGQHASTPAINATEAVAGNTVPVIGYTVTYAIANILLPLLSPIFVALFAATHAISSY